MADEQQSVPLDQTVTAGEAVKRMRISHRTLMELIDSGELRRIPYPRHKRVIRIPIEDIERWIQKAGPPLERKHEEKPNGRPALALAY